jgi:hypothetical protein
MSIGWWLGFSLVEFPRAFRVLNSLKCHSELDEPLMFGSALSD